MSQPSEATTPEDGLTLRNPKFVRFLAVNAVFITGMAILLFNDYEFTEVDNLWIWIPFTALWILAESLFAHGLKLGWKSWAILGAVLIFFDLTVVFISGGL